VGDDLAIASDGRVVLTARGRAPVMTRLTPPERSRLDVAVTRADLAPAPGRRPPRPDGFSYAITVDGATVHVVESAVPPGLTELLRVLLAILTRLTTEA
jgi:hypothetical protein